MGQFTPMQAHAPSRTTLRKISRQPLKMGQFCPAENEWRAPAALRRFQNGSLFDHLVRKGEKCARDREVKRLRSLQIDRQAEARRLLKRQVRRLRSFENAINKGCHTLEALVLIWPIGHQPTVTNEEIELVDGW